MAESRDQKTEAPTAKRLRDARERGQMARSRDLMLALSLLASSAALGSFGGWMILRLNGALRDALLSLASRARHDLQPEDLTSLILNTGATFGVVVAPLAAVAALTAIGAGVLQGGGRFSPKALRINWSALSPAHGFERLAPSRAWVDTLRAIVIVVALVIIALQIGRVMAHDSPLLSWMSPAGASSRAWAQISQLLWRVGFVLLAVGGADYALQHRRFMTSMKMTKQELRDEHRLSEGNPEIKGRVRRVQREMGRRRMLRATAKATVVVTNPTHYAVALEYRREKSPAPIVVAKGRDLIAQEIRKIARQNGVPIVENPPLARALHGSVEVGDAIPPSLFGAVAEVLAYLIRIKQLML